MTVLCALMLADRGELDLHAPVARYWPEFAANGKDGVEVRHLLGHTVGPVRLGASRSPPTTSTTGRSAPRCWPPRRRGGSPAPPRATTPSPRATCVGEVVRRITGAVARHVLRQGGRRPARRRLPHRPRRPRPTPGCRTSSRRRRCRSDGVDPTSIAFRTFSQPAPQRRVRRGPSRGAAPRSRRPTAMATPARSPRSSPPSPAAARWAGCACSRPRAATPSSRSSPYGTDLVLGVPLRFGMGYGLTSEETADRPEPGTCFWGGWGGSLVVNDLDASLTVAYVMNRMGEGTVGDARGAGLLLGRLRSRWPADREPGSLSRTRCLAFLAGAAARARRVPGPAGRRARRGRSGTRAAGARLRRGRHRARPRSSTPSLHAAERPRPGRVGCLRRGRPRPALRTARRHRRPGRR